jgi:hypothetical protein
MLPPTNVFEAIVSRQVGDTGDNDIYLGLLGSHAVATCETAASEVDVSGGTITTGVWHHLAAVAIPTSITLFIDGVGIPQTPYAAPLAPSTNRPIFLGGDRSDGLGSIDTASGNFLNGDIDEVQIETVERTPSWIAYAARSEADGVITYGPIEE